MYVMVGEDGPWRMSHGMFVRSSSPHWEGMHTEIAGLYFFAFLTECPSAGTMQGLVQEALHVRTSVST